MAEYDRLSTMDPVEWICEAWGGAWPSSGAYDVESGFVVYSVDDTESKTGEESNGARDDAASVTKTCTTHTR